MATETMSFVIDATEKMQSGRIGAPIAGSRAPIASR